MNRNPYKIYADFESILKPILKPSTKATIETNEHIAISYCLYYKSYDDA